MAGESEDLWQALAQSGEAIATEEDYEHGYKREVRGDLRQYVAFRVSGEAYGLPIAQIAEISKPLETTPVPRSSDFVLGIGNVRGSVIPLLSLARRLRLRTHAPTGHTRILIVKHDDELHGLLVDRVLGVVPIPPEDLEEAPGAIAGPRGEFITSLARYEGEILIILDLGALLDPKDFVAPRKRRSSERSRR